jgi:hypothetical protein
MANPTPRPFQENETIRLEAFSDGVFAIDIPLLTFELKALAFKEGYTNPDRPDFINPKHTD